MSQSNFRRHIITKHSLAGEGDDVLAAGTDVCKGPTLRGLTTGPSDSDPVFSGNHDTTMTGLRRPADTASGNLNTSAGSASVPVETHGVQTGGPVDESDEENTPAFGLEKFVRVQVQMPVGPGRDGRLCLPGPRGSTTASWSPLPVPVAPGHAAGDIGDASVETSDSEYAAAQQVEAFAYLPVFPEHPGRKSKLKDVKGTATKRKRWTQSGVDCARTDGPGGCSTSTS